VLWPGVRPVAPAAAAPAACDPSQPLQAPAGVTAVFPGGARDRTQIRWLAPPLSSCSLQGYRLTAVDAAGEKRGLQVCHQARRSAALLFPLACCSI
jgi:hypothetical protein